MHKTEMIKLRFILPVISCLLFFTSCNKIDVFEKHTAIPKYEWQANFTVKGSFEINDSLSAYNIYLVLRHTDAYAYNNIWLNIGLEAPGDTVFTQKADIQLGTDANGWEGTGMNDIWELRKLLNGEPRRFKKTGIYYFTINQIMRDNPLRHIMSAGMRIEKTEK